MRATLEPSIFGALLVLTIAFLPVFALQGEEGRLFRPLAFAKTFSMAFASLFAVTLVPALMVTLLRGNDFDTGVFSIRRRATPHRRCQP